MNNCDDPTVATALAMSLPEVNRLVLSYLIRFLQVNIYELPYYMRFTRHANFAMIQKNREDKVT